MLKWLVFIKFGFQSVDGIFLSGISSQQSSPEVQHREMQIPGLGEEHPSSAGWQPDQGELAPTEAQEIAFKYNK